MASGSSNMTTYQARIMAHSPNNTTTFLRGDNTFSNTLNTDLILDSTSGSTSPSLLLSCSAGSATDWKVQNVNGVLEFYSATNASTWGTRLAYLDTSGYFTANRVYNAVWNDYAEFRESKVLTPGLCVQENDDGQLTLADKRLIPGASIISDTYGFSEGKTANANTPVAVCGRVLAYTAQPRENYHAGMAVCSAPNGKIDIMTRAEIQEYPDAIIGIVSEIPQYEEWGTGNIKVDGRIWIKIK